MTCPTRMAGIQVSALRRGRPVDLDLPLLPFIDFMLCLVAFLMVTAAWSQMARLRASADAPGILAPDPSKPVTTLHLGVKDESFELTWQRGATVLTSRSVPRVRVTHADGSPTYPALSRELASEWRGQGTHRGVQDPQQDRAVLHTSNALGFDEVVAVMDAIHATKRTFRGPDGAVEVPAFAVTFAVE
jgi:biopolymer transport protein ExbD